MEAIVVRKLRRLAEELGKEMRYLDMETRSRKILFDHLPKCGGTTLSSYLAMNYPIRKSFSTGSRPAGPVDRFKAYPQKKRYGYDLIQGHLVHRLVDYVHPDCLKITVFRDPVERLISGYYYAKENPEHYLHSKILELGMSLEDYVASDLSSGYRNWYTAHFLGLTGDDIERNQNESIGKAVEIILNTYDIIGFLDDFPLFVKKVQDQACLRFVYKNKRVNVTKDRLPLESISHSAVKLIREMNFCDIAVYNEIKRKQGNQIMAMIQGTSRSSSEG